ncbi:cell division protein FtsI [freshwater metagenome]|uniref:Cell division protein FtsI n=1 Tax=freshwater metagenome TaxID=449393 RepID=A0A094PRW9_9ZZZZ
MNRELKRVSVVMLIMFLALFAAATVIQVAQADSLASDGRNTRTLYDSFRAQRGPIMAGETVLAQSVPVDDDFRFLRQYSSPLVYAPVTGFFTLNQGLSGIELSENSYLTGSNSSQFLEQLNSILTGRPTQGAAVTLTIRPDVQQAAWDALGNYQGAVVVTEVATGKILAMVSKPSFDPNLLAGHNFEAVIEYYNALDNDPAQPLINRPIGALDPPGSTFKLVTAAALLESGLYTPESTVENRARLPLPGTDVEIRNSDGKTCGPGDQVTLFTAVSLSCNVPLAEFGMALGYKPIVDMAKKFGFNQTFDVPMTSARSYIPQVMDEPQTALAAFGQFDVRATPLQVALVSAAIANGGVEMYPTLIEGITASDLRPISSFTPREYSRPISAETAAQLTAMMQASVSNGAATNASIENVSVAGKTGTAENGPDEPYTLWFTGFAPADSEPKYAITVVVENGGGMGTTGYGNLIAAPIARAVLEAVLK